MLRYLIPIAFATTLAGATSALAQPYETSTRVVSYADLDMSSAAGRARFQQRLHTAARAVCGRPTPVDVRGYLAMQVCRSGSFTEAWNRYSARVIVTASLSQGAAAGTR